jgi:uncharacterized protein YbjT (DUF2867 family)
MSAAKILAVGAAGKYAGLLLPELKKHGTGVRGFIRDEKDRARVLQMGATEVAIGDLTDLESLKKALNGIESLFYIAPAFLKNEAEVGKNVIRLAKEAGVKKVVFSSVIHPTLETLSNHSAKAPVESAIFNSDLDYTILQPSMFFQNFGESFSRIRETKAVAEPWSSETRFTRVDYRDVAEVAAVALTTNKFNKGTFELASEGRFNRKDVALMLSSILKEPIQAIVAPRPPEAPPEITKMFDWYDKHELDGNALTLRALLDREPRTLESYFKELAEKGARP